jgi:hypothetical protein
MSATQEANAIESLQDRIRELLIKNQHLRIALMEVKVREQIDCIRHGA